LPSYAMKTSPKSAALPASSATARVRARTLRPLVAGGLAAGLAACLALAACSPREPALAFTHVTLIDMTGAPAQRDMTVLIVRDKIAAVTPSDSDDVPWSATVIDGHGKYLIPGLTDMHVHLTAAGEPAGSREFMIPLLLANGITAVRDMGGYLDALLPLRREIETGKRFGPRILLAGPYLDGNPPAFQPSLTVTNKVQATDDVKDLIRRGVDFIKVQSNLSRDAYFAIAEASKAEHISFVGHVPDRVTASEASAAGQRSIEHLTGVLRACSSDEPKLMREQFLAATGKEKHVSSATRQDDWDGELLQSFSEDRAHALLDEFLRNGTWHTPTLILLRSDAYPAEHQPNAQDTRLKYVPQSVRDRWMQTLAQQDAHAAPRDYAERAGLMDKSEYVVREMQRAGVKVLAGTDSPAPFVYPGFALHDELALLVEAGLTPMAALQSATSRAADFMGKNATQGTIEKGKFADVVLLDENPLSDIHNTQRIEAVVLRGNLLDRNALNELLASAARYAPGH
jgi:imidazolonepropionase-like amidohydrolase